MFQIIRAKDRFHAENDWLSAYWLFSFDFYYDPNNMAFGPLRVFNHDTIQPDNGFGMHPHKNMEIVTYVLEGELDHKDSTGGVGKIGASEVQAMTAGTGVYHSEFNSSKTQQVRLMQMWVMPDKTGHKPGYEQKKFTETERSGVLLPIASGQGIGEAVKINRDVTFYVSKVRPGDRLSHILESGRRAFLYVIEGEARINDEVLESGDQARITEVSRLDIEANQESEIILIDLP